MSAFNELTPAEAERLALLLEELGEAQQAIGKVLRHGYESTHPDGGPTNREMLEDELGHVYFAAALLCESGDLEATGIFRSQSVKEEDVKQYLHHQEGAEEPRTP
jgi:NTP pyrophosphatase (non-canonical NTP hydrolase)